MIISNILSELKAHFKVYNTFAYLALFFIFVSICLAFILPHNLLSVQGPALLVIIITIAQNGIINNIFTNDHKDGTLEFLMSVMTVDKIILIKLLSLNIVSLSILLALMPIITMLYALELLHACRIFLTLCLMMVYVNSFTLLISAIQVYFSAACNFLTTLIFPLIIPGLICCVLSITHITDWALYVKLTLGFNCILQPIIFSMANYLIRNIYNI